ncbi:SRPBCC family protein, partial [Bacillus sp. SIMBA_005]|uniref:SRPBCC family protein n=1 Tax=Bacillus sp. SIMBA_005 TaxID=3085754 RepID=UPI003978013F
RMVLPDGNGIDWAGEFVEVAANERFVFTITDRPAEPEQAAIVVRLAETPEGTRMSFAQEAPGFTDEQKAGLLAGWQGFLDELE